MIRDLSSADQDQKIEADVVVVGAGIAGLLFATHVRGLRVLVLESGGHRQETETHPLNRVVETGLPYPGAEHGRFRCLGGTSTRWGGALLPFVREDMESHSAGWSPEWPIQQDELMSYLRDVERIFELPSGGFDVPDFVKPKTGGKPEFIARYAKWPAFKRRNVATVLRRELEEDTIEIWLGATVTAFQLGDNGRIEGITARGAGGSALHVRAQTVVLAAGAIESTRLLLLLDAANDEQIFAPRDILGRRLHDHISAPVANLIPRDRRRLSRLSSFRFEQRGLRNLRFELSGEARRRRRLPAGFVHIAFRLTGREGIDAVRDILRSVQMRRRPRSEDLVLLLRSAGWLASAAWWRFARKQLLIPQSAEFDVHVVSEQFPHPENRITLDPTERDAFGCRLASIDWRIRDIDIEAFEAISACFAAEWNGSNLSELADLEALPMKSWRERIPSGGGIYHPGGTVPMGAGPDKGVVDRDLRTFAIPNLRVISTAAFPTGGGANPTLMLMLFALRAADDVSAELAGHA